MFENRGSLSFNLEINQRGMLRLHAAMGDALERNEELPIPLEFKNVSRDADGGLNIVLEPSFNGRGQFANANPSSEPEATAADQKPNSFIMMSEEIRSGLLADQASGWPDETNQTEAINNGGPDLSSRQWEVLDLLSQGCSNLDIATKLHITTNTVKSHVRNVMVKLQTSNRIQTALAARTLLKRA